MNFKQRKNKYYLSRYKQNYLKVIHLIAIAISYKTKRKHKTENVLTAANLP